MVGTASALQVMVASSDPPYEALTQKIAYLMSAITNENSSKKQWMQWFETKLWKWLVLIHQVPKTKKG